MQDTLQKISALKAKINTLSRAAQQHNDVFDALTEQADALPENTKALIDELPQAVIDQIFQALDHEFDISLDQLNTKPTAKRPKRPIRGMRI